MICPTALTVAGSDSGGNAGIQADLRAFHIFGVHGCTVITALTAQNPNAVSGIFPVDPAFVTAQLDAVLPVYAVAAVKTGMLFSPGIIHAVAESFRKYKPAHIVADPVMVATSGAKLLDDEAIDVLVSDLLPQVSLITPNLPEAGVLCGHIPASSSEMVAAAEKLSVRFNTSVLIKGGHDSSDLAQDVLCTPGGVFSLSSPRIKNPVSTHGTGCSLSAALTASLACGNPLLEAVVEAKAYVFEAIRSGVFVGEKAGVMGMPRRLPVEVVRVERL